MKDLYVAAHMFAMEEAHYLFNYCQGSGDDDAHDTARELADEAIAEFGLTEDEKEYLDDLCGGTYETNHFGLTDLYRDLFFDEYKRHNNR
jgi:hypothetical protein